MAKKYRILESFGYRGKDGKNNKVITLGPGEDVPELDSDERARLLREEKICEVSENGENIRYKRLIDLDDEQIENLMKKGKLLIMAELRNVMYSKDTLAKIYSVADRLGTKGGAPFDKNFLEFIEQKISGEI